MGAIVLSSEALTFETFRLLNILNKHEIMRMHENIELKKALILSTLLSKNAMFMSLSGPILPYLRNNKKSFNNLKFNVYEKPIKHIWQAHYARVLCDGRLRAYVGMRGQVPIRQ